MTNDTTTPGAGEELKPCPFCGAEPDVIVRGGAAGVRCRREHLVQTYGANKAQAVSAWNTRAAASVTTASGNEEVARLFGLGWEAKNPSPPRPVAGEGETKPVAWDERCVQLSITELEAWDKAGLPLDEIKNWLSFGESVSCVLGQLIWMRSQASPAPPPPAEAWKPIGEDTPRDGTEIVGYRPDQGVFVFRWMTMGELVPKDANGDPTEDYDDTFAWWFHDRWGWMEGELTPTLWMNMPAQPALPTPAKGGA